MKLRSRYYENSNYEQLNVYKKMCKLVGRKGLSFKMYAGYGVESCSPVIYSHLLAAREGSSFNYLWLQNIDAANADMDMGWLKASGASIDYEDAIIRTIGEGIERFASMIYSDDLILFEKAINFEKRGEKYIDLTKYPCFTEKQLLKRRKIANFTKKDKNKKIGWIKGKTYLTNEEIWVPAQMVFLNYLEAVNKKIIKKANPEILYFPGTSSGAAAHEDRKKAIISGITELIERDAFMKTWICKLPVKEVKLDRWIQEELRIPKYQYKRMEVRVFDISKLKKLPAFLGVVINKSDSFPKFVIGGASGIPAVEGVKKAYIEAIHGLGYMRILKIFGKKSVKDTDIQNSTNFEDNVFYYADPKVFKHVEFLTIPSDCISI